MYGKQARRTGNSSPLGLIVDHGADSINAMMLPLTLTTMASVGQSICLPLIVIGITIGFYCATMEQYYCGFLNLPVLNGVSDGCIIMYLVGILSGIYGEPFWRTEVIYGLDISKVVSFAIAISAIPTIVTKYVTF